MTQESTTGRCPVRCVNCGEILAASIERDGTIVPIGVENDGTCGDAEFRVLDGGGSDAGAEEAEAATGDPSSVPEAAVANEP